VAETKIVEAIHRMNLETYGNEEEIDLVNEPILALANLKEVAVKSETGKGEKFRLESVHTYWHGNDAETNLHVRRMYENWLLNAQFKCGGCGMTHFFVFTAGADQIQSRLSYHSHTCVDELVKAQLRKKRELSLSKAILAEDHQHHLEAGHYDKRAVANVNPKSGVLIKMYL
jgi:hypothetical protein